VFKLGVHSIQQLQKGKTRTIFGTAKKVSVTLLSKIDADELSADEYASIMFCLNDDQGTYKRTYAARFGRFNDKCIDIIHETFRKPDLEFHDAAVSSAETAVEFFEKLCGHYDDLRYLASDYDPFITVLGTDSFSVSIASSGSILEILLPPFVFTHKPPDRWFYPVNKILFFIARKFWAKRLVAKYQSGLLPANVVRKIDIFSPRARHLASKDQRFRLGQHDLLAPMGDTFHCVRAMNVLNDSYFSAEQMRKILLNVHNSLKNNGLFITGSNQDPGSPVSGAVFSKNDSNFELVWMTAEAPQVLKHINLFNDRSDRHQ
jgi:hypothetical protein